MYMYKDNICTSGTTYGMYTGNICNHGIEYVYCTVNKAIQSDQHSLGSASIVFNELVLLAYLILDFTFHIFWIFELLETKK